MANMELITSVTVGAGGAASVTLPATGTIPQTYTDLKIVYSGRTSRSDGTADTVNVSFNGSTSNFSGKILYGYGSGVASSNTTRWFGSQNSGGSTANTFANVEAYIPNYTSSNYKSVSVDAVTENNDTAALSYLGAVLWSDTSAITTITLTPDSGNFVQYSTFYLYGISNVTSGSKATGGIVSSDGTYWYHMFPFSGTFTPTQSLTADYLVVAGGGGGGSGAGGGGGAGGLRSTVTATGGGGSLESPLSLTAQAYTVTVGAGGAGAAAQANQDTQAPGTAGSNSVFATITSTGGGYGAGGYVYAGGSGGSGGGGSFRQATAGGSKTASPVQGYDGGASLSGNTDGTGRGGGGGGAGAVGATGSTGNGGNGAAVSISGSSVTYAGGGGGGAWGNTDGASTGGSGGGGAGADSGSTGATNGTSASVNTGGGGGGGGGGGNPNGSGTGGAGGSGIVIIRYAI